MRNIEDVRNDAYLSLNKLLTKANLPYHIAPKSTTIPELIVILDELKSEINKLYLNGKNEFKMSDINALNFCLNIITLDTLNAYILSNWWRAK